ncbi:hypothetical protein [Methylobacterium terrae]|uniref:hypothetical protein n=1 Tax=Methylobacterium terrae TaxID=2202827 RepID=UPI0013A57AD8|nr:hypothetical protein [Methylobacterium terrae]
MGFFKDAPIRTTRLFERIPAGRHSAICRDSSSADRSIDLGRRDAVRVVPGVPPTPIPGAVSAARAGCRISQDEIAGLGMRRLRRGEIGVFGPPDTRSGRLLPDLVSPARAALERSRFPHREAISRKSYDTPDIEDARVGTTAG